MLRAWNFHFIVSTLRSLENHILCVCLLKGKTVKTLNNTPAKVNGSLRHYLVGANQRKMTCYILIWMNTDEIHILLAKKRQATRERHPVRERAVRLPFVWMIFFPPLYSFNVLLEVDGHHLLLSFSVINYL